VKTSLSENLDPKQKFLSREKEESRKKEMPRNVCEKRMGGEERKKKKKGRRKEAELVVEKHEKGQYGWKPTGGSFTSPGGKGKVVGGGRLGRHRTPGQGGKGARHRKPERERKIMGESKVNQPGGKTAREKDLKIRGRCGGWTRATGKGREVPTFKGGDRGRPIGEDNWKFKRVSLGLRGRGGSGSYRKVQGEGTQDILRL